MKSDFPILLAEDDLFYREFVGDTLSEAGYEFMAVENGREALELFDEEFFPIVLTDWMMPEMDGLELCRAIRKRDYPGYVYIIILTVLDSSDDIVTGLKSGADDYLTKPFDGAELIARLNTGKRVVELERALRKANEEIRLLSITDPLTGSYNRGFLDDHLPKEIKRAKRFHHPLSIVLCDIDHFKKVNDTFGHGTGDLVLKEFVRRINESIRSDVDWVVRFGGEEFIMVLPETDIKGACHLAEKLMNRFSKRAMKVQGEDIHITASFGVTGFGPDPLDEEMTPEAMIRKADHFMYQAKQEGRNRVKADLM
ncbi:MAG: diguanylate cyclase [Deltaproteobacteria bacterium]|nr:diguanylate cyclase [Deltaproteobacteria bacterium]